jgi:flagellar protein FlbD
VIILTRLGGQPMALNPDLIEKAEATPDTVITMLDGHKLVVADSIAEVVDKVRLWRASVAAEAFALSGEEPTTGGRAHGQSAPQEQGRDAVAQAGSGSSLARVLRMPAREE